VIRLPVRFKKNATCADELSDNHNGLKSHQRQLVDGSSPTYKAEAWILKSHQRQLVDGSSPTYKAEAWILKSHQRQLVDGSSPTYGAFATDRSEGASLFQQWSHHRKG
jgi:hypothetical protein